MRTFDSERRRRVRPVLLAALFAVLGGGGIGPELTRADEEGEEITSFLAPLRGHQQRLTALLAELDALDGKDQRLVKAAGKRKVNTFAVQGRALKIGKRTLHGWLDLAHLPGLIVPATPESNPCATCPHAKG